MPLVKGLLPLPLIGGTNESEDALLSQHPQLMINARYDKSPAVSKRPGMDCIGPYNTDLGANALPTGEILSVYNGQLIRIGGGKLHSYVGTTILGANAEWVYRDRVPECIVEASGIASSASSGFNSPQVCVNNGYAIYVYTASNASGNFIYADVVQLSTGARIYSQKQLAFSASSALQGPKAVASAAGTTVCIAWGDPGANAIQATWLDTSTMQILNTETAASAVTGTSFDIDAVGPTEVALVAERSSGSNRIFVYSFSNIPITGTWTIVHTGASIVSSETAVAALSLRYAPGERIWVSFTSSLTTSGAYVATLTTAFALGTAPFAAFGGLGLGTPTILGIERLSSTSCIVSISMGNGNETYWQECTSTGSLSYSPPREVLNLYMMSRPFVRNGRAYLLAANYHSTHATQVLLDLSAAETLPLNGSPRIVSVILPRQLATFVSHLPRGVVGANWALVGSNEYLVTSLVEGVTPSSFSLVSLKVRFDSDWTRTTAQTSNLLAIGGGALSIFDGSAVSEVGFLHEPDAASVTVTQGTGGSLTLLGVYGIAICYSWQDTQGNTQRSEPCFVGPITLTGSNNKFTVVIPCIQLTNKGANGINSPVTIEYYRTQTTGSTYTFVSSTPNVVGASTVTIVDTASDASIQANAAIYTTGSVLAHQIPAGGPNVISWKSGLILHASDDNSLWISFEVLQGEGPAFNSQENIASFDGGPITGLALLGEVPIIFKSDTTYYLQGDPPSDLGVSTITAPIKVQSESGCLSAASIVTSKYGLARMTKNGLYLLSSSLVDTNIGRPVEASYRGTMAGAAILPSEGLMRWLMMGTGGYDTLNWDYRNTEADGGAAVWSKDILRDVKGSTSANPVACTMWNGSFVWLSGAGYLYRENLANYSDNDGASTNTWVQMSFETAYTKPFGLAGWERVWRSLITGLQVSPHGLTVTITTDLGAQTVTWTDAELSALNGLPDEKLVIHMANQKIRWVKVLVQDSTPTTLSPGTYQGMILRDISLEIAQKPAGARFAATNRK